MTRQPAIHLRSPLPVTVKAKPHLKIDWEEPVEGFDRAVAFGAVEFGPLDMGDVVEEDKVRNPVNPDPGNRLSAIKMLLFLYDLGVMGNDVLMTVEALFHRRNPRVGGALHAGMAKPAGNLLHPGMDPVAEVNGLLGADISLRIEIVKVGHGGKEDAQNPQPNITVLWPDLMLFHRFPSSKVHEIKASPSLRGAA